MSSRKTVDPWRYTKIPMDSSTTPLYSNKYLEISNCDFYNLNPSTIPLSVEPGKLYLYRYLRYEPYFHEMFNLNKEVHPCNPMIPTAHEIKKLVNKMFFTTREPFTEVKAEGGVKKKVVTNKSMKAMEKELYDSMAYLQVAGLDETEDTHLSANDFKSEWASSDMKTGSTGTLKLNVHDERPKPIRPTEDLLSDPAEGHANVREMWRAVQRRHECQPILPEITNVLSSVLYSAVRPHSYLEGDSIVRRESSDLLTLKYQRNTPDSSVIHSEDDYHHEGTYNAYAS